MEIRDRLYIGGEWVAPATDDVIEVVSPHSEAVVARVPHASPADVDRAVEVARRAFDEGPWPQMDPADRGDVVAKISERVTGRMDEIARAITLCNGSPISWSPMGQVFSSTMAFDFYAKLAREYPWEEERTGLMGPSLVRREPVGVAAAIVPWNVPLFTLAMKLAPALVAGCSIVIKPAPETPLDAFLLAEILDELDLPPGVVSVLPAGRETGEHLVRHPGVDKVGFTGSTAAGRRIGAICGEQLKRVTLELGGKSAAILLPSADVASAIPALMPVSIMNNGEACLAQTRVLVPRNRHDEAVDAMVAAIEPLPVGDPFDPATQVGPLVSAAQRERVEGYLAAGKDAGARVALGGGRPSHLDTGWYVEPTVFADVTNDMTIAREEIFGPVVSVIPYDTVDDAVAMANDSEYGLSGSVWGDPDEALAVGRRIRTGHMNVNGFMLEACSPFGGYKSSGLGRELGPEGLEAYLEHKSINLLG